MPLGRQRISRWVMSPQMAARRGRRLPSDRAIERAVRWLTLLAAAIANLVGAAAVFVLAAWVLPSTGAEGEEASVLVNLVLAAAYIAIALPLGMAWALRRIEPGRRWLTEGSEPSDRQQRNLLRAPLHLFIVMGGMWLLAAVAFGAYNAISYSFELGQRVAITVALGGLATCAVAYLLSERLLRPAAARALSIRSLEKPAMPGVTARLVFAWGLGSGIPLLGVTLIALSTLTERDFSRDELALAALVLAGGGLALGFFAILLAARATSDPIRSLRGAVNQVEQGELDVEAPVYDGTEIGLLQSGFNRMVDGLRERARIRELFGMHVGEDVARSAMEREATLGGETREVAILFVDVVGSTEIAAERPPKEVVDLLNAFFGVVVDVVDSHGGWVNKFEGDAALAVYGAPEPLDDPAGCALATGRELSERIAAEVEGAEAGIGISCGQVVAGNVGSRKRFEYTVIGDPVNEAARLTELAKDKPGRVVAAAPVVEAASREEADRWELGDEVELRGRQRPTRLALMRATAREEGGSDADADERVGAGEGAP